MAENVQPGDWVEGPFWEAAVQVVGLETRDGYDVVTVAGRNQGSTRTFVITPTDWEQIRRSARADRRHIRFSGDASRFRLGIQAHRLRLAHSIDPCATLSASRIDPLSHQTETVQSHLLACDLEAMDIEIGPRAVLLRPAQVNALFPLAAQEDVPMALRGPRQSVSDVFHTARQMPTVQGQVDQPALAGAQGRRERPRGPDGSAGDPEARPRVSGGGYEGGVENEDRDV